MRGYIRYNNNAYTRWYSIEMKASMRSVIKSRRKFLLFSNLHNMLLNKRKNLLKCHEIERKWYAYAWFITGYSCWNERRKENYTPRAHPQENSTPANPRHRRPHNKSRSSGQSNERIERGERIFAVDVHFHRRYDPSFWDAEPCQNARNLTLAQLTILHLTLFTMFICNVQLSTCWIGNKTKRINFSISFIYLFEEIWFIQLSLWSLHQPVCIAFTQNPILFIIHIATSTQKTQNDFIFFLY